MCCEGTASPRSSRSVTSGTAIGRVVTSHQNGPGQLDGCQRALGARRQGVTVDHRPPVVTVGITAEKARPESAALDVVIQGGSTLSSVLTCGFVRPMILGCSLVAPGKHNDRDRPATTGSHRRASRPAKEGLEGVSNRVRAVRSRGEGRPDGGPGVEGIGK
jgi:hypothetical protein